MNLFSYLPQPLRRSLGHVYGQLEYLWDGSRLESWEGPFNRQVKRQELFAQMLAVIGFDAIVETGTFRGVTTAYMRETSGLPVWTVERSSRLCGFARARLRRFSNVHTHIGDSRSFLAGLAQEPALKDKTLLFYLDAHWDSDLPLVEEIELVLSITPYAVMLIDDFEVPGDAGYGFDTYANGQKLSLDLLPHDLQSRLHIFFPTSPSRDETGAKRGAVVLTPHAELGQSLGRDTPLLRPFQQANQS